MNDQPAGTTDDSGARPSAPYEEADVLFHGGEIVTAAADSRESDPRPEAVAVKDGVIVHVGDHREAVDRWQGPRTQVRDLAGRALLPGFIDAHGHLGGIGLQATLANLLAAPDGDVTDIASLQDKLRAWAKTPVGAFSQWIIGFGYDDAMLAEGRHPTREDLDAVSTTKPVLAIHQSFHLGAVNSRGLRELGYNRATADPDGGVIRRQSGPIARPFGEPNGVLEETAFNPASEKATAGLPLTALAALFGKGVASAASFGFTTVQEGGATLKNLKALRDAAALVPFKIDVVAYARADEATASPEPDPVGASQEYERGVRAAGVKMYLDGSPQGRTAWLTQPYLERPEGTPEGYRGYPTVDDPKIVLDQVRTAYARGWQVLAHVNGDAAIDQFVEAVEAAAEEAGPGDRRTVAIHAQTARENQIEAFARLGVIPSFFSMHTYYWGDWYRKTVLGPERAATISPARWAVDRQMIYTSHHDAPVALPNSIAILSSQVTRRTRTDQVVLGPEQCVSALDAVKSITVHAAHQYFEQDRKGSIEVGKLADLVILSANPLTVPPEQIKDIRVAETIKRGTTVHSAAGTKTDDPEPGLEAPTDYQWHGCC
ncbi:amidohydrolase [Kitasatospora sp. CB01950]|uniref:amidohydrolase n=1 Tax=Kitasatospora sp. CB01950 TaxID=1703930 RepID=UPI00095AABF8|nr:amidohydrolase [Kitasatospora sp. CB01950]OKJ09278.1 metal-dependent aminohydrolase [Kitasatospora sp. CB01950]